MSQSVVGNLNNDSPRKNKYLEKNEELEKDKLSRKHTSTFVKKIQNKNEKILQYLKKKNLSSKFERRRQILWKGFQKEYKIKVYSMIFFSVFFSMFLTFLLIFQLKMWDQSLYTDIQFCEQVNKDMIQLPLLSVAVKERSLNLKFYQENIFKNTKVVYTSFNLRDKQIINSKRPNDRLKQIISELYFEDICANYLYTHPDKKHICYKHFNRVFEHGINGFKDRVRILLAFFEEKEDILSHNITKREMYNLDRAIQFTVPILDKAFRKCASRIRTGFDEMYLCSILAVVLYCLMNLLVVIFQKKFIVDELVSNYQLYRGLFKQFIPLTTVMQEDNIKYNLIKSGVLLEK